jgi:uncharacterized protein YkwD
MVRRKSTAVTIIALVILASICFFSQKNESGELEDCLFREINDYRNQHGSMELQYDQNLAIVAQEHAQWLANNYNVAQLCGKDEYSINADITSPHIGANGSYPWDRVSRSEKMQNKCINVSNENIFISNSPLPTIVKEYGAEYLANKLVTQNFGKSPIGHNENQLNPLWDICGIGISQTKERYYLVVMFSDYCDCQNCTACKIYGKHHGKNTSSGYEYCYSSSN